MPTDSSPERLTPDEVGEVLRRAGVTGARFDGRPTLEAVAERAGMSENQVRQIVRSLRLLGTEIDAPSGDLEAIRLQAQDLEVLEEDPRAQARVAADEMGGVTMEGGAGKMTRGTKIVLALIAIVFFGMLVAFLIRQPTEPNRVGSGTRSSGALFARRA